MFTRRIKIIFIYLIFLSYIDRTFITKTKKDYNKKVRNIQMQSKLTIGVMAKAPKKDKNSSKETFITLNYFKWIESFGAQVVPIPYNFPISQIEELLPQINGLLIQGGRCRIKWPYTEEQIQEILEKHGHLPIEKVLQVMINKLLQKEGEKTPIFLICWGMELFPLIVTGEKREEVLQKSSGCRHVFMRTQNIIRESQLYKDFTEDELEILEKEKVTYHNHANNITPAFFKENEALDKNYPITSTTLDEGGMEFISSYEGLDYPLIAIQHHPEKIGISIKDIDENCLKLNRKFGEAFFNLCKKNANVLRDEKWIFRSDEENFDGHPYNAEIKEIEGIKFVVISRKEEMDNNK